MGEACRAAEPRMQAKLHFGEAELCPFDGNALMARQRDLKAATHRIAVDDRNGGKGQRFETVDDRMRGGDPVAHHRLVAHVTKLADIRAGKKALFLA